MSKLATILSSVLAAIAVAACGGASDKPATTNAPAADANAARPAAAAPTVDALMALDRQANEAYLKGDSAFFEGMLDARFVMLEGGHRMNKDEVVRRIAGVKCDVKDWKLEDAQMTTVDADTAVLIYTNTPDGACAGPDGKAMRLPSPVRAATVWVRSGDSWQAVFHGENAIVDPKNPPPPAAAVARKEEPKQDGKAAPAKATPGANTDALVKVELALWEAWKAKDARKLDELTAKDLSFVNIFGTSFATKADAMQDWTGGNCEVKSVSVTDGFATALSPTVEMLTRKGTADGTCAGQKFGAVIWGISIYVKDGDAWKFAFGLNSPA